jgi:hypothetical protein
MVRPGIAPASEHGETVEQRQAQVEHDRVVGLGVALEVRVAAIVGFIDRIAGLFVLDNQDAHQRAPAGGWLRDLLPITVPSRASTLSLTRAPLLRRTLIS